MMINRKHDGLMAKAEKQYEIRKVTLDEARALSKLAVKLPGFKRIVFI